MLASDEKKLLQLLRLSHDEGSWLREDCDRDAPSGDDDIRSVSSAVDDDDEDECRTSLKKGMDFSTETNKVSQTNNGKRHLI